VTQGVAMVADKNADARCRQHVKIPNHRDNTNCVPSIDFSTVRQNGKHYIHSIHNGKNMYRFRVGINAT